MRSGWPSPSKGRAARRSGRDAHLKIATSERFAGAVAAFERGDWEQAVAAFSEIGALNAGDGPARYYARRCRELAEPAIERGGRA